MWQDKDTKVHIIETGYLRLDGGAMFGVVPKVIWQKHFPADENNQIFLAMRGLLIQTQGKNILIDVGVGDKSDEKIKKIYAIDVEKENIKKSLENWGLKPADITDILITHMHFDHGGGLTEIKEGELQPTFPNAKVYIQKTNFDNILNPNPREKSSYLKDDIFPVNEAGLLELKEGGYTLYDRINVNVCNGHTKGQQNFIIKLDNKTLFYPGDTIPTSSHLHLPFTMGYDIDPLLIMKEKEDVLNRAVEENWEIVFEHDPYVKACKVKKEKNKFQSAEIICKGKDRNEN